VNNLAKPPNRYRQPRVEFADPVKLIGPEVFVALEIRRETDGVTEALRLRDPLQLFDYVRIGFLDECSNSSESLSPPVSKVSDSCRDQLRCRLIVARGRLLHGLLPPRQLTTYGSTNM
jgi:hypothetical protein